MTVTRDLFIRYCRYGDRLNVGVKARLKPTQFSRFCKDAIPFTTATRGYGSFRPVDVDIIFKCVLTQEVLAEDRRKAVVEEFETKLRVANTGVLPDGYGTPCRGSRAPINFCLLSSYGVGVFRVLDVGWKCV